MNAPHPPELDLDRGLADLVSGAARGRLAPAAITPETPLGSGGAALDSVELLELVVSIEERFAVEVEPEDLTRLDTFARLVDLVAARLPR